MLQFPDSARAGRYLRVYRDQLARCGDPDQLRVSTTASALGLIARRDYPDGSWSEVVRQTGARLTIVLLSDPDRRITPARSEALLEQIGRTGRR